MMKGLRDHFALLGLLLASLASSIPTPALAQTFTCTAGTITRSATADYYCTVSMPSAQSGAKTYAFTGVVGSVTGVLPGVTNPLNSVPVGAPITGTFTFNYGAAQPPTVTMPTLAVCSAPSVCPPTATSGTTGTLGSQTVSWVAESNSLVSGYYGPSGAPTEVCAYPTANVFSETVTVAGTSWTSEPVMAPDPQCTNSTQSMVQNVLSGWPTPTGAGLYALVLLQTDDAAGFGLTYSEAVNAFAGWDANGLPTGNSTPTGLQNMIAVGSPSGNGGFNIVEVNYTINTLVMQTPPSVTSTITGTQGTGGWYKTATSLNWTVTGSPAPTTSGCAAVPSVPDSKGTTYTCTASNSAGSANASVTIKKDTVAPAIIVSAPKAGTTYKLRSTLKAAYSCTDATSGIASCAGSVSNGATISTAKAGSYTFTVSAIDSAGNTKSSVVKYSVK